MSNTGAEYPTGHLAGHPGERQCGLYLITPPAFSLDDFLPRLTEAVQTGGVQSLQLRLKDASDEEILAAGKALLPVCHAHNCAFILNDRPDLAKAMGADGVHLGQDDLELWPIRKTRKLLGDEAVIGVSCHASPHLGMEAGENGADYVAFGAFYPTKSKPMEKLERWGTPTPDILEWWQTYTVLPCVAIGGITPGNCAPLVRAGADLIAVITAVWEHPEGPGAAVTALNTAIKTAIKQALKG